MESGPPDTPTTKVVLFPLKPARWIAETTSFSRMEMKVMPIALEVFRGKVCGIIVTQQTAAPVVTLQHAHRGQV